MRRLLARGSIALVMIMSFRTFRFFPGMFYVQEVWYAACFLFVFLVYPFWKMRTGLRFTRLELYLLLLIIASLGLAAWRAQQVFGQPLIYGILSQRDIVLIAAWLILSNMLRGEMINLADIEIVLLYLAWGTFALYSAARLFLNPSDFGTYGEGLVTRPVAGTEPSFAFQPYFLIFGTFYYAILGIRNRKKRYYLVAAVLFLGALGGSGRGLAVCSAATLIVLLVRLRGFGGTAIALLKLMSIVAVLGGVLYEIIPEMLSVRFVGFSDAFSVAAKGSITGDPSANARLFETLAALPYIQAHPLFGSGVVSHQWQGGSEMAMGEYFFATDIGILGIVFSFGIFGLCLYAFQYRVAWLAVKKLSGSFNNPLLDATKAFIIFSVFYSLQSGLCVWDAGATIFFVTLLDGIAARDFTQSFTDNRNLERCPTLRPALSA